ncbi:Serine-threonine/tyrosine-protein kinase, catalytic domain [Dillenia turbinata]|uniref:Serine-threonine/tyrosine-protein kinase, catalytic domain n=1 Tax=Dillenia turbinata TaxID=194707 RepID=A0AAN8UNV2_9MAGN
MISECDGKSNPYSIYSAKELEKATNKYDPNQLIDSDPYFDMYKGFHEEYDCPILVKCFRDYGLEKAIKEIVLSSQANRHKNVLRLLGCCLETEIPILVFEYPHCGTLSKHIGTEKDHVVGRIVDRTLGHAALEFTIPDWITEKVDVFGFGIVLLEILLGESRFETFLKVDQLLDQSHQAPTASGMASSSLKVDEEINNAHQHHRASSSDSAKVLPGAESEQFMACGELALKCRRENPEERPTMTEVAEELRRIIRSQSSTSNEK